MTEIKEKPLFLLTLFLASIVPLFFKKWLGAEVWMMLAVIAALTMMFSLFALLKQQATSHIIAFGRVFFFGMIILPYVVIFKEFSSWSLLIPLLACYIFADLHRHLKWLYVLVAMALLVAPIIVYMKYDTAKQAIIHHSTQTLSGSIPKSKSSFTKPCGKGSSCTFYFLNLAGVKFQCDLHSKKTMDKFICQDIYQHAGKTATAQYILENQKEARLVSLRVDNQTLWSPEQTLAWYQHRERTVWREFGAGLLLIGLPFALLFLWARRLAFQAA